MFVVGHVWRYRYDKFGWTTRSSQLYESRLLRLGSPLFHVGILLVAIGHVGGVLLPKSWTEAVGIGETAYHVVAVGLGAVAGFCILAGAAILVYRRRTVGPVFSATTRNDKVMYVLLVGTIVLGLGTTVLGNLTGDPHDYRESVSPWFRSILLPARTRPDGRRPTRLPAPCPRRLGTVVFWPFSRLVHVFSMPLGPPHRIDSSSSSKQTQWTGRHSGQYDLRAFSRRLS